MADSFTKLPTGTSRFQGYTSDPTNADPSYLAPPSQNCLVTDDGKVESRKGYKSAFSIGSDGDNATSFYHKTYDIAFFALGTKVFYRDFTTGINYNTGITLTSGTTTRFDEFFGDVYLTNTTNGIIRIVVMRLNGNVASGASAIVVDVDGAARLSVFGDTTGDLRIKGTNETFTGVTVSSGSLALSPNATQAYNDNDIAIFIDNSYSSLDEPSKILFWKSRMHIMGFPSAANADQPNNTVMAGQFVIGSTGATGIENIIDFTYGTGGSTKIVVGGGGKVTNILGVADTIYFFTENKVHFALSDNITTSGSSIGLTIPDEKDSIHGCLNEDCAAVMGNNALTYVTNDRRIMRIPIDTDKGAPLSAPEEDFDVAIRDHLKNMDRNQTGALVFHYNGGRQTIYQLRISGQWFWFIFDQNIVRPQGSNFVRGAWQPPQRIVPVTSLFERDGVLYGTDMSDDEVYTFFTAFSDNLSPIRSTIATGEFNVGNALLKKAQLQGDINFPSEISILCYVWNENRGKRSGSPKVIYGSDYNYGDNQSVGAVPVGDGGVAASTDIAKWHREFDIFPSEASRAQLVLENSENGACWSLSAFSISGNQYPHSFSNSL